MTSPLFREVPRRPGSPERSTGWSLRCPADRRGRCRDRREHLRRPTPSTRGPRIAAWPGPPSSGNSGSAFGMVATAGISVTLRPIRRLEGSERSSRTCRVPQSADRSLVAHGVIGVPARVIGARVGVGDRVGDRVGPDCAGEAAGPVQAETSNTRAATKPARRRCNCENLHGLGPRVHASVASCVHAAGVRPGVGRTSAPVDVFA